MVVLVGEIVVDDSSFVNAGSVNHLRFPVLHVEPITTLSPSQILVPVVDISDGAEGVAVTFTFIDEGALEQPFSEQTP